MTNISKHKKLYIFILLFISFSTVACDGDDIPEPSEYVDTSNTEEDVEKQDNNNIQPPRQNQNSQRNQNYQRDQIPRQFDNVPLEDRESRNQHNMEEKGHQESFQRFSESKGEASD